MSACRAGLGNQGVAWPGRAPRLIVIKCRSEGGRSDDGPPAYLSVVLFPTSNHHPPSPLSHPPLPSSSLALLSLDWLAMATVNISYTPDGELSLCVRSRPNTRCSPRSLSRLTPSSLSSFPPSLVGNIVAPSYEDTVYNMGDMAWILTSTALVFIMIPGVGECAPFDRAETRRS